MCVINGRNILRNKAYEPNKKNGYTWQPAPQDERDDGQNFWLNKLQEADFRRVMAAKQIPNL